MGEYLVKFDIQKDIQEDNYYNGLSDDIERVYTIKDGYIAYDGSKADLLGKLAEYLSEDNDVFIADFIRFAQVFEEGENIITYGQHEDIRGNMIELTEDNEQGYFARYTFTITEYYTKTYKGLVD